MDTLSFISRYEAILKERKIPKMQFYKDCSVSDAAVSQWRKGRTNPSMSTINRIASYLSVSVEYLLTGEKKEKPTPDKIESEFVVDYSNLSEENKTKAREYIAFLLSLQ